MKDKKQKKLIDSEALPRDPSSTSAELADRATTRLLQRAWKLYRKPEDLFEATAAPPGQESKTSKIKLPSVESLSHPPSMDTFKMEGRNSFWNSARAKLANVLSRTDALEPDIEDVALMSAVGPCQFLSWSQDAAEDFFAVQKSISRENKLGTVTNDDETLFGEAEVRAGARAETREEDPARAWSDRGPIRGYWDDEIGQPDEEEEPLDEEQKLEFASFVESVGNSSLPTETKSKTSGRSANRNSRSNAVDPPAKQKGLRNALYNAYVWDAPKSDTFPRASSPQKQLTWNQGCNADLGPRNVRYPFVPGPALQANSQGERGLDGRHHPVDRLISSRPAQVAALNAAPECSYVSSSLGSILSVGSQVVAKENMGSELRGMRGVVRGGPFVMQDYPEHAYLVHWRMNAEDADENDDSVLLVSRSCLAHSKFDSAALTGREVDLSPYLACVNRWGEEMKSVVPFEAWLKLVRLVLDIYRRQGKLFNDHAEELSGFLSGHFPGIHSVKDFVLKQLLEGNRPLKVMSSTQAPFRLVSDTFPSDLMRLERRMLAPLRRSLFHYDVDERLSQFLIRHRSLTHDVRGLLGLLLGRVASAEDVGRCLMEDSELADVVIEDMEKFLADAVSKEALRKKLEDFFGNLLLDSDSFSRRLRRCLVKPDSPTERGSFSQSAGSLCIRTQVKRFVEICHDLHSYLPAKDVNTETKPTPHALLRNALNRAALRHAAARAVLGLEISSMARSEDLDRYAHPALVKAVRATLDVGSGRGMSASDVWKKSCDTHVVTLAELAASPFLVESCRSIKKSSEVGVIDAQRYSSLVEAVDSVSTSFLKHMSAENGLDFDTRTTSDATRSGIQNSLGRRLCSYLHVNYDMELIRARRRVLNRLMTLYNVSADETGVVQCIPRKDRRISLRACNRDNCAGKRPTNARKTQSKDDEHLRCHFGTTETDDGEIVRECVTNKDSEALPRPHGKQIILMLDVNKDDMPNPLLFSCTNPIKDTIARWESLKVAHRRSFLDFCGRKKFLEKLSPVFERLKTHEPFKSLKPPVSTQQIFDKFRTMLTDTFETLKEEQREILAGGLQDLERELLGENSDDNADRVLLDEFQVHLKCDGNRPKIEFVDDPTATEPETTRKVASLTRNFALRCVTERRPRRIFVGEASAWKALVSPEEGSREWETHATDRTDADLRAVARRVVDDLIARSKTQIASVERDALYAHAAGYVKLEPVGVVATIIDEFGSASPDTLELASLRWRRLTRSGAGIQIRIMAFQILSIAEANLAPEITTKLLSKTESSALLAHAAKLLSLRSEDERLGKFIEEVNQSLRELEKKRDLVLPKSAVYIATFLAKHDLPGITVGTWLSATDSTRSAVKEAATSAIADALVSADQVCAPRRGRDECGRQTQQEAEENDLTGYGQVERCSWKLSKVQPVLQCEKRTTPNTNQFQEKVITLRSRILDAVLHSLKNVDVEGVVIDNVSEKLRDMLEPRLRKKPHLPTVTIFETLLAEKVGARAVDIVKTYFAMYEGTSAAKGKFSFYPGTGASSDPTTHFRLFNLGFMGYGPLLLNEVVAERLSFQEDGLDLDAAQRDALWNFYVNMSVFIFSYQARSLLKLARSLLQRPRKLITDRLHPPVLALLIYCCDDLVASRNHDVERPTRPESSAAEKIELAVVKDLANEIRGRALTAAAARPRVEMDAARIQTATQLVERTLTKIERFFKEERVRVDAYLQKYVTYHAASDKFKLHVVALTEASPVRARVTYPFMSTASRTSLGHSFPDIVDVEDLLDTPLLVSDLRDLRYEILCARSARTKQCQLSDSPDLSGTCAPKLSGLRCWEDVLALPASRTSIGSVATCEDTEIEEDEKPEARAELEVLVLHALEKSKVWNASHEHPPEFVENSQSIVVDTVVTLVEILRKSARTVTRGLGSVPLTWSCGGKGGERDKIDLQRLCALFRSLSVTLLLSEVLQPRSIAPPWLIFFDRGNLGFDVHFKRIGGERLAMTRQRHAAFDASISAKIGLCLADENRSDWDVRFDGSSHVIRNLVDIDRHPAGSNRRAIVLADVVTGDEASSVRRALSSRAAAAQTAEVPEEVPTEMPDNRAREALVLLHALFHPEASAILCQQLLNIAFDKEGAKKAYLDGKDIPQKFSPL